MADAAPLHNPLRSTAAHAATFTPADNAATSRAPLDQHRDFLSARAGVAPTDHHGGLARTGWGEVTGYMASVTGEEIDGSHRFVREIRYFL